MVPEEELSYNLFNEDFFSEGFDEDFDVQMDEEDAMLAEVCSLTPFFISRPFTRYWTG